VLECICLGILYEYVVEWVAQWFTEPFT